MNNLGRIRSEAEDARLRLEMQQREMALHRREGNPTLAGMEPASKEYVDLKLDAAMSRIEARLDIIRDNQISPWQVWGAALTGFGAVLAVLSFGGDQFGLGVTLADKRQEQIQRDAEQDDIIKRLDALLSAQATQPAPTPENPNE